VLAGSVMSFVCCCALAATMCIGEAWSKRFLPSSPNVTLLVNIRGRLTWHHRAHEALGAGPRWSQARGGVSTAASLIGVSKRSAGAIVRLLGPLATGHVDERLPQVDVPPRVWPALRMAPIQGLHQPLESGAVVE
jgi:hypothetical protein